MGSIADYVMWGMLIISFSIVVVMYRQNVKVQKTVKKLSFRLMELDQKVTNLLWKETDLCVKHTYSTNKAREHCFELEIINTLAEPISLLEVYAYPPDGKVSYAEIALPQEKDANGQMRVNRSNYNEKVTLERVKTRIDVDLMPEQQTTVRYVLKFKDAVFASRRPDIYLCYQSKKRSGIREIKITEKNGSATLHALLPEKNAVNAPVSSNSAYMMAKLFQ